MSDPKVNIGVDVTGNAGSQLDQLAAKVRQLKREDSLSGERAVGSFLNRGAGGLADVGLSALGVGLPAMMADFAFNSIRQTAEGLSNLRNEFDGTSESVGKMLFTVASGIPIFGSAVTALDAVLDAVTGEGAAIKEADAATKRYLETKKMMLTHDKAVAGATAGFGQDAAGFIHQAAMRGMPDGLAKDRAEILWQDKQAHDRLAEKRDQALRDAGADDATIQRLRDRDNANFLSGKLPGDPVSGEQHLALQNAEKIRQGWGSAAQALEDETHKALLGADATARDATGKLAKEQTDKQESIMADARVRELAALEQQQEAESSLRQKALKAKGMDLDAEIEQIHENYRRKREAASSDPEMMALFASEKLDIAGAQKRANTWNNFANQPAHAWTQAQRFNTGDSEARASELEDRRWQESAAQMKEQITTLSAILDLLKSTQLTVMGGTDE